MKKIFTLFTLCLLATVAWGQTTIEFVAGETVGNNQTASGADEMTISPVKISTTSGGFNCKQGEQYQYRFAKSSDNTIETLDGSIITEIKFTCTASGDAQYGPGNFQADGYTYAENVGTWKGSATKVVIKAVTAQVRATKVEVTITGGGLIAPNITPAAGTYYAPIEVSMNCLTAGASIYYTTNGNEPTTSSTKYTAPFTVSTNTTVKAISAKDGETSDVVTAVYEFSTATPVANIREFQQVPDETVVVFTNPVSVLAQSGQRLYVKDDTGRALFYGSCGQTYVNGDVIPAGFVGTKTTWDGEPELKNLENFQPKSSNSPIAPQVITASQVDAGLFAQYVRLNDVTFDKTGKLVVDASGNAPYYCNMNVKEADIEAGATYEYILAIVGSYGKENTVYQLLPTYLEKGGGPDPGEGYALCEMGDVDDNATVVIKNDAIVLGQSGQYLYLKDTECGYGLMYGACGQTYDFGDVIPAGYGGTKTTWDGEPELKNLTNFKAATSEVSASLVPDDITPNQVGHEMWGHYVLLKQVTIDVDGKTLNKGGESCPYYPDRFGIAMPNDGKAHDVYGIVASYGKAPNTVYQILPLSIDEKPKRKDQVVVTVECLQDLYALNKGQVATFTMPLTAIYQNKGKKDLYIIDSCGEHGLVYGDVDGEFVNGDFINDAKASWTTYNDNYQLSPVANTFVVAGHSDPVEPEMMPVEEISQDLIHHFLAFENVSVIVREEGDKTNYYLVDETGEIMLFDRYSIGIADLDLTKTYDIKGFLTIFSKDRIMEIYPIEVKVHGAGNPYDVNGDREVNIADVNVLIDYILTGSNVFDVNRDGEMNIADVNTLIDYILSH